MRVLIVGSGPAGLTLGAPLARRGHEVISVDRDPGPAADGTWRRRGVMQFQHAHGFRPQVRDLLLAEWPDAHDEWVRLGAEPISFELPNGSPGGTVVRSRRSTYERALRAAAGRVRGLTLRTGHVDGLLERRGRVVGAVIDGSRCDADLLVDASGRTARIVGPADDELGGDCGIAYVNRCYRLHEGAPLGPLTMPIAWGGTFDGYHAMAFPHEHGHFSVVVVRPTADVALQELRHRDAFEAACRAIPALAAWTDPDRSTPTTDVLVGGRLRNVYREQQRVPGVVAVGDSVSTTTPTVGRGVAMTSMQIGALLDLLDRGADPVTVAEPFGDWCDEHIRPWVEDHIARDDESARRLQGADIDLSRPLTSTAIVDAAQADQRILEHVGGFLGMTALPATLAPAEPLARAAYLSGWRPPYSEGPSRDELVAIIESAMHRNGSPSWSPMASSGETPERERLSA
jgi:2-polyprenyl-6-methoxyphenol hydroxylase-like FAD-dependent oxidoreductase